MKMAYLCLFAAVLLTAQVHTQIKIDALRFKKELGFRYIFKSVEGWDGFLSGGFRGLLADLLWIRADEYSHRGQWYKLLPLFKMVTFLQPKFITAWSVGGWHMTFNLHFHSQTSEKKAKWLKEGIKFLKEGILNNPDQYELYFELGWVYFYKLMDYPNAIRYLKRATSFPHPQYVEHLLAYAFERNKQFDEALIVWKGLQKQNSREKNLQRIVNRAVTRIEQRIKTNEKLIDK
jgi:tetratricopeptide (TPR) repeat protein